MCFIILLFFSVIIRFSFSCEQSLYDSDASYAYVLVMSETSYCYCSSLYSLVTVISEVSFRFSMDLSSIVSCSGLRFYLKKHMFLVLVFVDVTFLLSFSWILSWMPLEVSIDYFIVRNMLHSMLELQLREEVSIVSESLVRLKLKLTLRWREVVYYDRHPSSTHPHIYGIPTGLVPQFYYIRYDPCRERLVSGPLILSPSPVVLQLVLYSTLSTSTLYMSDYIVRTRY